jgi:predicted RNA-binding Zn-ribbon protein involved in translation (DUF1610 family)
MRNYRTIFEKNPLFHTCPACGEMNSLHRSRSHNWKEGFIKKVSFFKIYRCTQCGWRGYLSTKNLSVSALKFIAYYFGVAVITAFIVLEILRRFVH